MPSPSIFNSTSRPKAADALYARVQAEFPAPSGDPATWNRVQAIHHQYHHPESFCPEPYDAYPAHLHIDLLEHARGLGLGRRLIDRLLDDLRARGVPGVHLGVDEANANGIGFYEHLGFREVAREPGGLIMGLRLR